MIEVIFDTETTGLAPENGDRIIEIGALKLKDRMEVVDEFHVYINPKRSIPKESFQVHGISEEFLQDKPTFDVIANSFLEFIGKFPLVAHNAAFDIKFLNYELAALGHNNISNGRVVDTLAIARKRFPGSPASLDALCKRFGIDLEARKKYGHGALLDAKLLTAVYQNLRRKNNVILFEDTSNNDEKSEKAQDKTSAKVDFPHREFEINEQDYAKYKAMIKKLVDDA